MRGKGTNFHKMKATGNGLYMTTNQGKLVFSIWDCPCLGYTATSTSAKQCHSFPLTSTVLQAKMFFL